MKKFKVFIIILVIIIGVSVFFLVSKDEKELRTIKSEKELLEIYEGDRVDSSNLFIKLATLPISLAFWDNYYGVSNGSSIDSTNSLDSSLGSPDSYAGDAQNSTSTETKDYSTTNIQVENVDEADIVKTDGNYIYSLSGNDVIITNVENPQEIKIEATIAARSNSIPEDLILNENYLIIISTKSNSSNYNSYRKKNNTIVSIYNIETKSKPVLEKSYELYEPYYTSRCIDNELYVIASGDLRKEDGKIERAYREDGREEEIKFDNIKYLEDVKTDKQTIISAVDLNNVKNAVDINSFLIDVSNAYVSENSIYLLDEKYNSEMPTVKDLFGLKGIFGVFTKMDYYDENYGTNTEIYKFDISVDGDVSYSTKNEVKGTTINQYSLDEYEGNLRIALDDYDGARIVVFDEELNQIGESDYVAEGETMYSSRFMGDKAYLITYKNTDPLFSIDLSDPTKPRVLGELHIPGYSTYLHPYDENHLIGIGIETEEVVNRNSSGKVLSTSIKVTGMKMALFDVSDINNPIELSNTVIGDKKTTSAILTNPKALLFSKERNLIAIPVNNFKEDFEFKSPNETNSSLIHFYKEESKSYIGEGYFVYNINLEDGFDLRGVVTHETVEESDGPRIYSNNNKTKLLRGLYIEDNLYTVSEVGIKVNNLETLELVSELKIEE